MKIGITGSNGFIGKHLIRELKKKHECFSFDKEDGYDILNLEQLKSFVKDKDCIIHLAGMLRGDNFDIFKINTIGTQRVLEAIKECEHKPRLIFASSFQVYKPIKEKRQINETFAEPQTEYGLSKYLSEKLILFYSKKYNIKSIILRLSNVYGPGSIPNHYSVISTFVYKAQRGEEMNVSDLSSSRDFIFISDVIEVFSKIIDYKTDFDIFNVCSGKLTSLGEIIKILNKFKKVKFKTLNKEEGYVLGDNSKLKKCINFKTKIDIETGIKLMWDWFKKDYKGN